MEDNKVVLLDWWASPFSMRVKVALAEKGIKYESKEQNLFNKSQELLEANPVHKKIPVLIHDGKSICESLVILQYIDEVWHDKSPLLPSDPYQRSQARFWADYVEKKLYITGWRVWTGKGEDQEVAKKELIELLKTMEGELGDKHFFGGDTIGFLDVVLVPFTNLGGDAADVEARAAKGTALLDTRGLEAELGGFDGGDIASESTSVDDDGKRERDPAFLIGGF
ncbi:hypothetical protein EZV62_018834 [Acer yangbiense]|uniref:glutathione transferase n=1 Tax=Acer yangbiense TaxID=1000413 RepID=A0A5C7H9A4_9ROSI|nr:hypothetical protein EZV62_018834 [Acer yangbiense]